ncbi:MAG: isoprenoid biosynthesis glyoxalase ElbB [Pseudomonadota bacterium]|nr:isoprenoid biosynthesis glyoxalase ElbB [Pseudomonadota bacterium]
MKFAVLLSGCGVYDGSEIGEVVLTLMALEDQGIEWDSFAPSRKSLKHVNHVTQKDMPGELNVLEEASRIVRGRIADVNDVDFSHYDGLIVPGGFGVVTNLCDFSVSDMNYTIYPEVDNFLNKAKSRGFPMGFMCIAPILIPRIFQGVSMTIGNDKEMAGKIEKLGCRHVDCVADDIVIDRDNKVVTTPANMLAKNLVELRDGIVKLVGACQDLVA